MIHLDTGFLISALRRGSAEDRRLREWLAQSQSIGISAVGWAEFLCGPVDVHDVELATRVVEEPVALLDLMPGWLRSCSTSPAAGVAR